MGRELKRVALDFEWPLDKVWEGYLNPHYKHARDCPFCDGSGSSEEARKLKDKWYGNVPFSPEDRGSVPFTPYNPIVRKRAEWNVKDRWNKVPELKELELVREAQRLCELYNQAWNHHLNQDDVNALVKQGRLSDLVKTIYNKETEAYDLAEGAVIPTAKQVNEWSIDFGLGHDSINQWIVVRAECDRLEVDSTCTYCGGNGTLWESPDMEIAADEWVRVEPPTGEGYQIWETVSEGSPISPVFATPEELAEYMTGRKWGADTGTPYGTWLNFITKVGWAPSLVLSRNGLQNGVDAVTCVERS